MRHGTICVHCKKEQFSAIIIFRDFFFREWAHHFGFDLNERDAEGKLSRAAEYWKMNYEAMRTYIVDECLPKIFR